MADLKKLLLIRVIRKGTLIYYTTMIADATRPLLQAFQKKYPYINVIIWRGGSDQVVPRIMEEYRVNKYTVDVKKIKKEIIMKGG